MPKKIKIGLVCADSNGGLAYIRGHSILRYLDSNLFEVIPVDTHALQNNQALYMDVLIFIHSYSKENLVLIQRAKYHFQIPVIYDLDDLLTEMQSDHPKYSQIALEARRNVPKMLQLADHVTVSTEYMQKKFFHLNKNITVIENVVDPKRYEGFMKVHKPYHSGFVVGWTGSLTHVSDQYYTFLEPLIKFMNDYDDVRAHFHALCPQRLIDLFGSRVIFDPYMVDYMDYPAKTITYPWDVCLVGLYDHPFNHAKSDLRLLDMAMVEIPIIASPVTDFVKHKDRDIMLYADNDMGWYNTLKWARENRTEIHNMAKRSKEYVLENRTVKHSLAKWEAVLQKVLHPKDQDTLDQTAPVHDNEIQARGHAIGM